MTRRIYFAYPPNIADTDLELGFVNDIYRYFEGMVEVVNLSDFLHKKPIADIKALSASAEECEARTSAYEQQIIRSCQGCIGLLFPDGKIDLQVYKKLADMQGRHHSIWTIDHRGEIELIDEIKNLKRLSKIKTKERIYNQDGTFRLYA